MMGSPVPCSPEDVSEDDELVRTVRHSGLWLLATAFTTLATTALGGAPGTTDIADATKAAESDLLQVQGRWEREEPPNSDAPYRSAVKEVSGEEEIVTYYRADGSVWRSHRAQFKLSRSGGVKVVTFSNVQISEGDGKGSRFPGPSSYIYAATDKQFKEVSGFLPGQEGQTPSVLVWQRAREDPGRVVTLPKPDARLQGSWIPFHSEEGGVDRKDQGDYIVKFDGDRFIVWRNGRLMLRGTFTTYTAREPRRVDILIQEDADNPTNAGKTLQGIYAIEGEELRWCTGTTAAPQPPTELTTRDGEPFMLVAMKREKVAADKG